MSRTPPPTARTRVSPAGVDNKSIGYTKEELYAALEKMPYPIYTVGCTYKENNEQLKNMFALSRMTGGASWLLDDVSDYMARVSPAGNVGSAGSGTGSAVGEGVSSNTSGTGLGRRANIRLHRDYHALWQG